jgi:hypothetical protein
MNKPSTADAAATTHLGRYANHEEPPLITMDLYYSLWLL